MIKIFQADVLKALPALDESSFDACLCDPPYALEFMGKDWDRAIPGPAVWSEVLRVLKPGAHLLAFGGTRTFHRLICAIEDSGFEIRDCLMWMYATGFPKSLDISKAIDASEGAEREIIGTTSVCGSYRRDYLARMGYRPEGEPFRGERDGAPITAPATEMAKRWDGYGTALAPSWEPITLAMKGFVGTFAENAVIQGVAGINVDGCRIGDEARFSRSAVPSHDQETFINSPGSGQEYTGRIVTGRWPKNTILDPGAGDLLDAQTGDRPSGKMQPTKTGGGAIFKHAQNSFTTMETYGDTGGPSRFYFCAKASPSERGGCPHPTLKPIELTAYLAKLLLPPPRDDPRRLLVPFCGAGSEMIGALRSGWDEVIGIELDPESVKWAVKRITDDAPLLNQVTVKK